MIEVRWTRTALKQLLRVDTRYRQAIKDKVGALKDFPLVAMDFKKLSGSDNRFRLRVGVYRVIFDVEDGDPVVLDIKEIKRRSTTTY
ncbi:MULTISPECIES: type II toxin-antitoxin system RelE family toxin [Escherichia]|uniref:Plasmid stabilisation system protein n=1 Tax=Escherichia coli TaxID=562 RepID=A0A0K4ZM24_ECOLX|nr:MULTISPECIES: type II toxin-antitoxin system RelE/ParE family toxin [Escherichia]EFO0930711.1 type II toxin-antitoxin system RelE/ParE family toxin [Escherichia coli O157]EFW0793327.1 type II toxin-antitoxin system RelE/ParE family toxin [Shigella sonnei]EFZ2304900.1 type II toxin-antitoxin system RelE/ParE family toxin [Shigella boydii]EKB6304199.1 type II toxin-antitoxin system RelE/ParE family toxin [Shigella flexneri]BCI50127.1 plasmid stabilization protein [Enterobacteria phage PPyecE_